MKPQYRTIIVTFSESIETLNNIFDNTVSWGVSSLKEWIDCYESTRFTQIGDNKAVITSEYNISNVYEWLQKFTVITEKTEE